MKVTTESNWFLLFQMPDHSNFECVVFATCPVSPIVSPLEYEKIKILRCLMLKEKSPDKWKLLMNLQSHIANRKQDVAAVSRELLYNCLKSPIG